MNHPPIPISELAEHTDLLKANDNLKLSQEYEVSSLGSGGHSGLRVEKQEGQRLPARHTSRFNGRRLE